MRVTDCRESTAFVLSLQLLLPGAAALGTATLGTALASFSPNTLSNGQVDASQLLPRFCRADGDFLEGVHSDASHPLTQRVLTRVPELADWDHWYAHPPALANGHVHTILAAKLRRTRAVMYHRQLVPTPDGGTLAIDLLAGVQSAATESQSRPLLRTAASMLGGGTVAGAEEDANRSYTLFVREEPPADRSRPMLLLASGLGGGSQDTYVRSMAASAAERGWQVAVLNMRACGSSPVTSPRLFSAYRGANDDVRLAVSHLRKTRLRAGTPIAAVGWSNSGTIINNVLAEQSTTHPGDEHALDAAAALATPLNMPANSANLARPFHSLVYDRNLGRSLRVLWAAARDQYIDADGKPIPVPVWDGCDDRRAEGAEVEGAGAARATFVADDRAARTVSSVRDLDEALTRRQYGYASVDEYYVRLSPQAQRGHELRVRAPTPHAPALLTRAIPALLRRRQHRATSASLRSNRRCCYSTLTTIRSSLGSLSSARSRRRAGTRT